MVEVVWGGGQKPHPFEGIKCFWKYGKCTILDLGHS